MSPSNRHPELSQQAKGISRHNISDADIYPTTHPSIRSISLAISPRFESSEILSPLPLFRPVMRLLLLPISTRQSLLYCHRTAQRSPTTAPTWSDRITNKASTTWLNWEKKNSGWQKRVTEYGNQLFKRLPHEEWGLKSIPPMSAEWRAAEVQHNEVVAVEYPEGLIKEGTVINALRRLGGNEKQAFHFKWFLGSIAGMPLTAPIALVPM